MLWAGHCQCSALFGFRRLIYRRSTRQGPALLSTGDWSFGSYPDRLEGRVLNIPPGTRTKTFFPRGGCSTHPPNPKPGFPAADKQQIEETVLTRRFHGMHWGALHSTGRADSPTVGSSHPSWILCTGGVHIFLPPGGEVAGSTFPLRGGMQMTRIILVCHRSNSARDIRRTVIDQEPPGSRFAPAGSLNRGPAGVIQKIPTRTY